MDLVGVENVELTGKAGAAYAAVPEALHARRRDPDRVGVVSVAFERPGREAHLGAFQTGRARPEANRVTPWAAGSFKTIGIQPP
jgi:hypothetical protein